MSSIIKNVVGRTNNELYVGVVGSVRSGKSMFIRKFMQMKVLPYVDESYKNLIIDELPQSADGKAIMTVEPKFIPSTPALVTLNENLTFSVRMVDCVGYIIKSAKGYINEDGTPKLVKTPWYTDGIEFSEAASLGTKKVMENHSHIGILMTSDGSFGEFTRNEYEEIEEQLVNEMIALNKPFVIVLNTAEVSSLKTKALVTQLEEKYKISVVAVNVASLSESDVDYILEEALNEFDIAKLEISAPTWLTGLNDEIELKQNFNELIKSTTGEYRKFKYVSEIRQKIFDSELFEKVEITDINSKDGIVTILLHPKEELYDEILKSIVGDSVNDKGEFILTLQDAMKAKAEYAKYKSALESVAMTGYGVAIPDVLDMKLDTPEIIKQSSRYGIKLRALAPSIHMIKVDVESSFEPIIGSEEQSKSLVDKLMEDYNSDSSKMWSSEIFGRKLSEVVNDGIRAKLYTFPDTVQQKLRDCLEKIVNKNKGGLIAIIL